MTDVPLKEHLEQQIQALDVRVDQRISDLDVRIAQRFELIRIALDKADSTMSVRLDNMNEFRDALKDQANRGVTRDLYDKLNEDVNIVKQKMIDRELYSRLESKVNQLAENQANRDGRIAVIASIVSAVTGTAMYLLVHWLGH